LLYIYIVNYTVCWLWDREQSICYIN